MTGILERHEIRIRGRDHTIVFIADSQDGRLVIRQEPDGKKSKEVCAIRLSDPDELRAFFKGLRRILSSLGYAVESGEAPAVTRREKPRAGIGSREDERDAVVAQARQKNPVAFAPWTRKKSEKSADVMRQEKISKQSLVHTNGLPVLSSFVSNASVCCRASKNGVRARPRLRGGAIGAGPASERWEADTIPRAPGLCRAARYRLLLQRLPAKVARYCTRLRDHGDGARICRGCPRTVAAQTDIGN
jgi:hypothetical protein